MSMRTPRTVDLDERLWEAVQRAAADDGVAEQDLIEEALRRYFGLRGAALLDEIADAVEPLGDDDAMTLAISEIRAAREERRRAVGA
jgi:hypothetical protein